MFIAEEDIYPTPESAENAYWKNGYANGEYDDEYTNDSYHYFTYKISLMTIMSGKSLEVTIQKRNDYIKVGTGGNDGDSCVPNEENCVE